MKRKTSLSVLMLGLAISVLSQNTPLELTFTALFNRQYILLDSLLIENLTLGGDTILHAPDSVLVLDYLSSIDGEFILDNSFILSQNYPNPFIGKTTINLNLPETEHVEMIVRDILGSEMAKYDNTLSNGEHSFRFYSGSQKYYLLTVYGEQSSKTIKMLNTYTSYAGKCKIVYNGYEDKIIAYKSQNNTNSFGFELGNELKYTGYSDIGERTITDSPSDNQIYTFQFADLRPCAGIASITDIDGNTYKTVQIGSQCWMAENLKTTTYHNGVPIPKVTNNGDWSNLTTAAYAWYNNDIEWKDPYGALYNWFTTVDTSGLCPTGWHVPTNDEWTVLTESIGGTNEPHGNELKSCRQVNSPLGGECNTSEHPRWNEHNMHYGSDDFGFSGLPGGYRYLDGIFHNIEGDGLWWSSTESSSTHAWDRDLDYDRGFVGKGGYPKLAGFSIRCVRD